MRSEKKNILTLKKTIAPPPFKSLWCLKLCNWEYITKSEEIETFAWKKIYSILEALITPDISNLLKVPSMGWERWRELVHKYNLYELFFFLILLIRPKDERHTALDDSTMESVLGSNDEELSEGEIEGEEEEQENDGKK